MPTALSDPSTALYLILFVVVVVTGGVWFRNRKRSSLVNFGIAAGVLGLLFLIDRMVESPREEAVRRVQAMAAAATVPGSPDAFLEHVSPSFTYGGATRESLRTSAAWGLIRQHNVVVTVSGLGKGDDYEMLGDSELELGFYAKAQTPSGERLMRYVKARFVRDPDGAFRVKTMKFYTPGVSGRQEDPIPGFP